VFSDKSQFIQIADATALPNTQLFCAHDHEEQPRALICVTP
jgi:hypothetical protein